jgi:hypothetical protein
MVFKMVGNKIALALTAIVDSGRKDPTDEENIIEPADWAVKLTSLGPLELTIPLKVIPLETATEYLIEPFTLLPLGCADVSITFDMARLPKAPLEPRLPP